MRAIGPDDEMKEGSAGTVLTSQQVAGLPWSSGRAGWERRVERSVDMSEKIEEILAGEAVRMSLLLGLRGAVEGPGEGLMW